GDPGPSRMDVGEVPRGQPSTAVDAAGDVDDGGGAEVRPGELLLARPPDLHRTARGPGQPRRLHRDLAGVLPPEPAAGGRNDDSHAVLVHTELLGQPRPDAD